MAPSGLLALRSRKGWWRSPRFFEPGDGCDGERCVEVELPASTMRSITEVSMVPGQTALIRTPRAAYSDGRALSPSIPSMRAQGSSRPCTGFGERRRRTSSRRYPPSSGRLAETAAIQVAGLEWTVSSTEYGGERLTVIGQDPSGRITPSVGHHRGLRRPAAEGPSEVAQARRLLERDLLAGPTRAVIGGMAIPRGMVQRTASRARQAISGTTWAARSSLRRCGSLCLVGKPHAGRGADPRRKRCWRTLAASAEPWPSRSAQRRKMLSRAGKGSRRP